MGPLAGFKYKEVTRKLKRAGFRFDRSAKGSHEIWWNPDTRASMHCLRCYTLLSALLLIMMSTGTSLSAPYEFAQPSFNNGQCTVSIWLHSRNEANWRRVQYEGSYSEEGVLAEKYCHVEIPNEVFEQYFQACFLSKVEVLKGNNNTWTAEFGGGPGGGREAYWFTWGDPKYVLPGFSCVRK